jgi:hypothetical protein
VTRTPTRAALVLRALLVVLAGGEAARADRGVSIDLGRIEIEQPLAPGGSYRLPTIGVRNPGDERTRYRLNVAAVDVEGAKAPPVAWFRFSPAELELGPGGERAVSARLFIPTDAAPADYVALIGPEIVAGTEGASVGAAAAARIRFTVEPSSTLAAWWLWVKTWMTDHAPWSFLMPGLLGLALLLAWMRRRFAFTVARRA